MATLKDPLQPVIALVKDLTTLQGGVQAVQPLAADLTTDLQKLETALAAPAKAKSDLSDLDSLLGDIKDLVEALSEIEFLEFLSILVDPISLLRTGIGDATDLLGSLDDALKPVNDGLDKLNDPVNDIDNVSTALDQHMGVWLRQLELIDDSVQVAQGIALLVKGDFGSELDKIIAVYTGMSADLLKVVSPVTGALQGVESNIKDAQGGISQFTSKFSDLAKIADKVDDAFKKIAFLKPILKAIHDALKPVKWALDAVACVFDHVVKPILDALIPKSFRDEIKHLFEKLLDISGIQSAVKDVESFVQQNAAVITKPVESLVGQAQTLSGLNGSVISTLDKHLDLSFNQQLAQLATDLGKAPKNGDINIQPFTSGYDKFWGIANNLLNLLKANSNDHDVIVTIDTILGAGNALIEANKGQNLSFRAELPLQSVQSAASPDSVAFWLKVKSYLETIKANTKDENILVMVATVIGAGDSYFKAQKSVAGFFPQTLSISLKGASTMQSTATSPSDASVASDPTQQIILQMMAELYPALQSIVDLIGKKFPAFRVPGATIMGGLGNFLQAEGFAIDTNYKTDLPAKGEYFIQLNNIKPPTVTNEGGQSFPVTAVTNDADFEQSVPKKFCTEWPVVAGMLQTLINVIDKDLPPELAAKLTAELDKVLAVGATVDALLCGDSASGN